MDHRANERTVCLGMPPAGLSPARRVCAPVTVCLMRLRRRGAREDGVFLVLTAMLLTVMLGMAALAIDTGSFDQAKAQAQLAADAGAVSAAESLPGSAAAATTSATTYASTNDSGATVSATTPFGGNSSEAQVSVTKTIPAIFGAALGVNHATVSATAVAVHNDNEIVSDYNFATPFYCYVNCSFASGQTFGAWTVWRGNVDLSECTINQGGDSGDQPYFSPPPGDAAYSYVVDLNGNLEGGIQQSIPTTSGQAYTLTFELSGNPSWGQTSFVGQAAVTSGTFYSDTDFSHTNPSYGNTWQQQTISFTAAATSTLLQFASNTTGPGDEYLAGPLVGDVEVYDTSIALVR
jgi:Flp pilus assembly protein TadG